MQRKLGIVASCLDGVSELDALKKIKDAGFETFFTGAYKNDDVRAIRGRADELGLKYEFIHAPFRGINQMWMPGVGYDKIFGQMKESIDFIKIKDYAVINLNNMIPVPDSQIVDIDLNKEKEPSYRYLLQAESREISRQKNRIRKNAEIVYSHKKHNDNSTALAKRTNNFELLEKLCKEY